MAQTLLEQIVSILNSSKKGDQLPLATSLVEQDYLLLWSDANNRLERIQNTVTSGSFILQSEKGAADGVAPLDSSSVIDPSFLPSDVKNLLKGTYVSSTIFNDPLAVPYIGSENSIYLDTTTKDIYEWDGVNYIVISEGSLSPFEEIDEGDGIAYTIRGRDPANYGEIGSGSFDLSFSGSPSTTLGALGQFGIISGFENSASGYADVVNGALINTTGNYSTVFGTIVTITGDGSHARGSLITVDGIASTCDGQSNVSTGHFTHSAGTGLLQRSSGGFLCGQANLDYLGPSPNSGDNIMLGVGNGTINVGDGSANTRSDALNVYLDGRIIAPSLTTALIDANLRSLITREFFDLNSSDHHSGFILIQTGESIEINENKEMIVTRQTVDGTLTVNGVLTIL